MTFFPSQASKTTGCSRPSFKPQLETLEDRCVPASLSRPLTPIIFVPGQPASLPTDFVAAVNRDDAPGAVAALNNFLTHLGTDPAKLTSIFDLDPVPGLPQFDIVSPTNSLVEALKGKGYVLGVN